MPENKNQSYANWPSVSGGRTTGGIDLRGLNPVMAQRREMLRAYQQRLAGDVAATRQISDINSRLTKITQDLGASSIARQEQLMVSRQANHQRMMELYGNYFQQFGNVLNKDALDFLDQHSNIKVPTLTAIMAGYEHARASQAEQQLAMLDRQAKMAEAQYALDKQAADLQTLKEANDALLQQQNLKNQADAVTAINKSQSQYLTDVAEKVYAGRGVAGGRGTGVAGAGGLGGSSAAGSFQAPVTGGGGTGAVAGGGATGFVDPSNPQVAALNKMIDDSKAAQTAGQGVQYGPLTQREIDIDKQITTFGDFGNTRNLAITSIAAPIVGGALTSYGSRAQLGYLDKQGKAIYDIANSDYMNFKNQTDIARLNLEAEEANIRRLARNDPRFSRHASMERYLRGIERRNELRMDYMRRGIPIPRGLQDSPVEAQIRNRLLNANNLRSSLASATITERQGLQARNLIADQFLGGQSKIDMANKATAFQRGRGLIARGAGKLASKVLGHVSWALTTLDLADEVYGGGAAIGRWLRNTGEDLLGVTTERLRQDPNYLENRITPGQEYDRRRNAFLAGENILLNRISGSRWNVGLENDIANMTIKRMRELGYEPNANEITQISMNIGRSEQDSANALEALLRAQGDGSGNLAGTNDSIIKFYNDVLAESAYQRTYATQANKAAQNQQVTNQEIVRDQRIADALANKPKFFAGMAEYLTRVGREAGYDFDEADAAAMMGRLIEMNQAMESGGKFGAEGENTSTGTAKSRHQFMDMTFDQLRKWMLEDDNKAGGIFFDDNERNALRQARTANDLDNEQFGHLLDLMVPYYLMKDNVNIGKFGKGNPNIGSLQALVDLAQMTKDIGISPYLDSSMNALRMAGFGRFKAGKEFDETVSRFNRDWQGPIWSAQFGDRATSNGAYRSRDMYLQDFANNGILLGPYQNKVPANEYLQWVNEYFVVDKDGNITGIKEGANPKHLDKWREENGLTRMQKVGVPQQIVRSNNVRLDKGVNFDNLNRTLRQRVNKFADNLYSHYGFGIDVTSGHRTPEDQARVKRDPNSSMPANPGSSPHQAGLGIDLSIRRLREAFNKSDAAKQKYNGDFNKFIEEEAKAAGLYRFNPKGDPFHFGMIEDDDYKANVDHDLYMKDKAAGKLSDSKRYEKNQSLTLPSLPTLRQVQPFSPALWTDPVVEPANQGIVDPLDLSAFDGMMPGGVNFSPTNYGVAMEQLQQYIPENQ